MCAKVLYRRQGGLAVLILLCGPMTWLMLGADGCLDTHEPASESDTVTLSESEGADGTASTSVTSRWAAPTSSYNLSVEVTSPDVLTATDATLQVTLTCQFGNTKTFTVPLSVKDGSASGTLLGTFVGTANASDGSECIGVGGQKEAAKWTATFGRPSTSQQELSFSYQADYRLASIASP